MALSGKSLWNPLDHFRPLLRHINLRHILSFAVLLFIAREGNPLASDTMHRIGDCPIECKCLDKGSIMTCRHNYLHRVPYLLSTTMFLDLDDNRLSLVKNASIINVPRLEMLSLQSNEIADIEAGAFLFIPELRILRLGNNHLASLPKDIFWNNRHLEVLDLHGNHFSEVPDTVMYHLHSLQLLNLSYNEITSPYLGPGFKYTTQLRGIDLTRNDIVSLESNVFQSTLWWDESIKHSLNLSYCNIHHIHPYAFGKLYRLQVLSLAGNPKINHEDLKRALADLEVSTLTSLNLSWMNITDAYEYFQRFQHRRLLELNLANNNIDTIRKGTFFYLVNLKRLDLSYNSINIIGDLNSLAKLEYLSLGFNTINDIGGMTFEGLHNLKYLDLSHNSLTHLTDEPFQTLFYLNTLHLSCNLISEVSISTGLEHLEYLDISSNRLLNIRFVHQLPRIRRLQMSDNSLLSLPALLFRTDLLYVNLSSNMISTIDPDAFSDSTQQILDLSYNRITHLNHFGWENVRKLYLSNNYIFNVSDESFDGLLMLEEIDLSNNNINWIPSGLFINTIIRYLDLSGNPLNIACLEPALSISGGRIHYLYLNDIKMNIIPTNLLTNLSSLRHLDLSFNHIQTISSITFPSLHMLNLSHNLITSPDPSVFFHLDSVDLSFNPFSCTCHLMPFRYWILSANISHRTHIVHSKQYLCNSPAEWLSISVWDFYVEGSSCSPHEKVVIFTAVGCTVVALLLTLLLAVYKCKCCQVGKFDSARYSAIDDRLDQLQQEQRLVSCEQTSSSPATTSEINQNSLSSGHPWL